MGSGDTTYKVRELITISIIILLIATGITFAQTLRKNAAIVSDKAVSTVQDTTINIVDKDEIQRIVNMFSDRIQKLEERESTLESKINDLDYKISTMEDRIRILEE